VAEWLKSPWVKLTGAALPSSSQPVAGRAKLTLALSNNIKVKLTGASRQRHPLLLQFPAQRTKKLYYFWPLPEH
jgi:hypothetical protein